MKWLYRSNTLYHNSGWQLGQGRRWGPPKTSCSWKYVQRWVVNPLVIYPGIEGLGLLNPVRCAWFFLRYLWPWYPEQLYWAIYCTPFYCIVLVGITVDCTYTHLREYSFFLVWSRKLSTLTAQPKMCRSGDNVWILVTWPHILSTYVSMGKLGQLLYETKIQAVLGSAPNFWPFGSDKTFIWCPVIIHPSWYV